MAVHAGAGVERQEDRKWEEEEEWRQQEGGAGGASARLRVRGRTFVGSSAGEAVSGGTEEREQGTLGVQEWSKGIR